MIMQHFCYQCEAEMSDEWKVKVARRGYRFRISKRIGFLRRKKKKVYAAICTICGFVAFYAKDFDDIEV